ncbi:hypothetical protein [Actinacidiphila sp. bgisy144]|uniref:hypothetical protein n=1 Tax=Actinacidiphila sp. bgisy144 TaxID=3413791 RepID=UPI003EC12935
MTPRGLHGQYAHSSEELPFTDEDVRRAAADICAQSLCRLDHPSGTGEFLEDRAISSSCAAGKPTGWSALPVAAFTAVADQLHRLITDAADYTYLAASSTQPTRLPTYLDHLLPPAIELGIAGTDIRHAALCLAHDLIEEELRQGPILSGILDEPIASTFTLDGPAPTWGQLPARHLIHGLHLIHQTVEHAQIHIDAAVDTAIRATVPEQLPTPATTAAANSGSTAIHNDPAQPPGPPASIKPAPTGGPAPASGRAR